VLYIRHCDVAGQGADVTKAVKKKKAKKSTAPKKRGGSVRRIILEAQHFETIGKLAGIGCSHEDICELLAPMGLKMCAKTLYRRLNEIPEFKEAYDRGIANRNIKLRSRMFQQAMMMNGAGVHMSQFLAVNFLGMSHKVEKQDRGENSNELTSAKDRLALKLEALAKRLIGREIDLGREPPPQMAQITYAGGSGGA